MNAARIEHYITRITDTKTVEGLDAIIRELEERQSTVPDDVVPQYVIGMARMERFLSFGVTL